MRRKRWKMGRKERESEKSHEENEKK